MAPLLLLLACAPDPGPKSDSGDGADAPVVDAPVGGTVYGWGADGLWVLGDDGFVALTADPPEGAAASGAHVTSWRAGVVTVWSLADRAAVREHPVGCGDHEWIEGALDHQGSLWVACGAEQGPGPVLQVAPDGSTEESGAYATALQADQGALYALYDWGREGQQLAPVDPATLAPTAEAEWIGFGAEARGAGWFGVWGELGNSDHGGVRLGRWDAPDAEVSVDLAAGEIPALADAVGGAFTLVDLFDQESDEARAVLLDGAGARLDELPACPSPRLRWAGDHLEGWCADPVRRYDWTWDGAGWTRTGEVSHPVDLASLRVIEPGD